MPAATDQQVQTFVNTRVRTACEQIRALKLNLDDILASIEDVYVALNVPSPTWTDDRPDGPPHLAQPADVLAFNTLATNVRNAIAGDGQYPVALKLCVRPVSNP